MFSYGQLTCANCLDCGSVLGLGFETNVYCWQFANTIVTYYCVYLGNANTIIVVYIVFLLLKPTRLTIKQQILCWKRSYKAVLSKWGLFIQDDAALYYLRSVSCNGSLPFYHPFTHLFTLPPPLFLTYWECYQETCSCVSCTLQVPPGS